MADNRWDDADKRTGERVYDEGIRKAALRDADKRMGERAYNQIARKGKTRTATTRRGGGRS